MKVNIFIKWKHSFLKKKKKKKSKEGRNLLQSMNRIENY